MTRAFSVFFLVSALGCGDVPSDATGVFLTVDHNPGLTLDNLTALFTDESSAELGEVRVPGEGAGLVPGRERFLVYLSVDLDGEEVRVDVEGRSGTELRATARTYATLVAGEAVEAAVVLTPR